MLVASTTLLERKLLAIIQRRVGPDKLGYHGRLQYIADALKLLSKGILIPENVFKLEFSILPFISIFVVYTFWTFIYWDSNITIIDVEYNIPYLAVASLFFGFSVISVGILSKNKYTILASFRFIIVTLNNELLLGCLWLVFSMSLTSVSFSYSILGGRYFFITCCALIIPTLIVCFFSEVGRTPFDFGESESELVAGYTTELSGFLFVLYYLGEYYHLILMSNVYGLILFNLV